MDMNTMLGFAQKFLAPEGHEDSVRQAAEQNPDDEQIYRQAAQHVARNTDEHRPVSDDEAEEAKQAHHQIYRQGNTDNLEAMGSNAVGGAVATQVIQKFMSGGGGGQGGGDLMSFAMTEASQLLSGSNNQDFKTEVIQKAAMMIFKSQMSGGGGGGGAMSLLSKFM